jgi:hypothetical protein
MIRRLVVVAGIGLALVVAGRFALGELTERAWKRRREELLALAVHPTPLRRPWELRFETLLLRTDFATHRGEHWDSAHVPIVAWGGEDARPLDEFERVWLESVLADWDGLEAILAELRRLPLEDLTWGGATAKLLDLREATDVLCARAWQDLGEGDGAGAARAYSDALRLVRATDDGTTLALMVRAACENTVLAAARAALDFAADARELRAALTPHLADWIDPAGAEDRMRRDLCWLEEPGADSEEHWDDPAFALGQFRDFETVLQRARVPFRCDDERADLHGQARAWDGLLRVLAERHARRNVACTALAVAASRASSGAFPSALDSIPDLRAEESLDPFTDRRLPYRVSDGLARIGPASSCDPRAAGEAHGERALCQWTLRGARGE